MSYQISTIVLVALSLVLVACGSGRPDDVGVQREVLTLVESQTALKHSGWAVGDDGIRRYWDPQTAAPYTGWLEEAGTRRYLVDGVTQVGWLELGGASYYLGADGVAVTGWSDVDGVRCFFDESGARVLGWVNDGSGKRYWIKPEDGTLASHEWIEIDGLYQAFDDNGSWVTLGEVVPPEDAEHVESMSARQRSVVEACEHTPWPGKGLCAGWVSNVFANAGESVPGGDACDMACDWCVSSDLSDLRPGMLIAVESHGRTDNGRIWGHVGIYKGGGIVCDSGTYGIRHSSLGSWLAWFGDLNEPRWGWANGISLEDS